LNSIIRKIRDNLLNNLLTIDCPLYFRLIKFEKFPERFKEELEKEGHIGLKRALFGEDEDYLK